VTSPGNAAPPVICGTNSGEHMYVDASEMCNTLAFQLGTTSTVTRAWTIKISQYDCNYDNLAPDGCTQYFYGGTMNDVKSYNYDGGQHLAQQNQNICVRRERNYCEICWSEVGTMDFQLTEANGNGKITHSCCDYKASGKGQVGADCLIIPNAIKNTGMDLAKGGYPFCGGMLASIHDMASKTVCSKSYPFNIRFLSDLHESDAEDGVVQKGFRLSYFLRSC